MPKSDNLVLALVRAHYRLGYTRALLFADSILLMLILMDVIAYSYRLSTIPAFASTELPFSLTIPVLFLELCLVFVLPMAIAVSKIVGAPLLRDVNPARRTESVLVTHLVLCAFFVYAAYITERMEILSGWREVSRSVTDIGYTTAFRSSFGALVRSSVFIRGITALGSLAGLAVTAIAGWLLIGMEPSKPLRFYVARANLADLPYELVPRTGINQFNHANASLSVPAIAKVTEQLLKSYYQRSAPATDQIQQLDAALAECRSIISKRLIQRDQSQSRNEDEITGASIYTGPGRALESAIRSIGPLNSCILFPYSSASIAGLVEAYCSMSHCELVKLILEPKQYYSSWSEQEEFLIGQLRSRVTPTSRAVLILNHVDCLSGLRIPLESLIQRLRAELPPNSFRIIIDGTNAVANRCLIPAAADWDAYLFAPYKWLMTTQRCAVVLRKPSGAGLPSDYGLLQDGTRKRDEEVRIVASLLSSLRVLDAHGVEFFWSRCHQLREAFQIGLPKAIQVVGSQSEQQGTYILSCYPTESSGWRRPTNELEDAFSKISPYASIVSIDSKRQWLRVALPYHLDPRVLNRLNDALDDYTS